MKLGTAYIQTSQAGRCFYTTGISIDHHVDDIHLSGIETSPPTLFPGNLNLAVGSVRVARKD